MILLAYYYDVEKRKDFNLPNTWYTALYKQGAGPHRQSGRVALYCQSHITVFLQYLWYCRARVDLYLFMQKPGHPGWQTWQTTTGDNTGTHTTNNFNLYISTNTLFN